MLGLVICTFVKVGKIMNSWKHYLKKIETDHVVNISLEDVLNEKPFTYKKVIEEMNLLATQLEDETFFICSMESEVKLDFTHVDQALNSIVDEEWSTPQVEIGRKLSWHIQENERIIELESLSDKLIAVYYDTWDEAHCFCILTKKLYFERKIASSIQYFLVDIHSGDIDLTMAIEAYGKENVEKVVKFLMDSDYIIAVKKILKDDYEIIELTDYIEWENLAENSIEFTDLGRKAFFDNTLGISLTRRIEN